jgi:hypothetical protein
MVCLNFNTRSSLLGLSTQLDVQRLCKTAVRAETLMCHCGCCSIKSKRSHVPDFLPKQAAIKDHIATSWMPYTLWEMTQNIVAKPWKDPGR